MNSQPGMDMSEARELLNRYADGLLEPEKSKALEALLATTPELRKELEEIREENALLSEALAPLRPSRSARMKLSEAMRDIHARAEEMAESVPERGWRLIRLLFAFFSLALAVAIALLAPPAVSTVNENFVMACAAAVSFGVGLVFCLGGRTLAKLESAVMNAITRRESKASALGVLTLEVFGMLAVVAAGAIYFVYLR